MLSDLLLLLLPKKEPTPHLLRKLLIIEAYFDEADENDRDAFLSESASVAFFAIVIESDTEFDKLLRRRLSLIYKNKRLKLPRKRQCIRLNVLK